VRQESWTWGAEVGNYGMSGCGSTVRVGGSVSLSLSLSLRLSLRQHTQGSVDGEGEIEVVGQRRGSWCAS
jgi:hypothetical protein